MSNDEELKYQIVKDKLNFVTDYLKKGQTVNAVHLLSLTVDNLLDNIMQNEREQKVLMEEIIKLKRK